MERQRPVSQVSVNFGINLDKLIARSGISQEELSRITKVPSATLSRYVNCETEISLKYAHILARYFQRTVDELMRGGETNCERQDYHPTHR